MGNIDRPLQYCGPAIGSWSVYFFHGVGTDNEPENENLNLERKIDTTRKLKRDNFLICMQTVTPLDAHARKNLVNIFFVIHKARSNVTRVNPGDSLLCFSFYY